MTPLNRFLCVVAVVLIVRSLRVFRARKSLEAYAAGVKRFAGSDYEVLSRTLAPPPAAAHINRHEPEVLKIGFRHLGDYRNRVYCKDGGCHHAAVYTNSDNTCYAYISYYLLARQYYGTTLPFISLTGRKLKTRGIQIDYQDNSRIAALDLQFKSKLPDATVFVFSHRSAFSDMLKAVQEERAKHSGEPYQIGTLEQYFTVQEIFREQSVNRHKLRLAQLQQLMHSDNSDNYF